MTNQLVLVTGAAGYVGSHCLIELLNNGYKVVAIDNCMNAIETEDVTHHTIMPESLRRVQTITGHQLVKYYKVDINDRKQLDTIFNEHRFEAVIHFASLKAVGESCQIPLEYYRNNVSGAVTLFETMKKYAVKRLIFSSSATVYGYPDYLPIDEKHHTGRNCTNPYGRTKFFIEEILKDLCNSEKDWNVVSLRYFNPVGAHDSGEIGEDPQGIPNNLMPYIAQVAVGRQPFLKVFGNDFNTNDGTGVRDYIHIMDLASGHVVTLDKMLSESDSGWEVYNLGAGTGYSVLDVISAFEKSTGVQIPYKIFDRRSGDVDELWADIGKATNQLNWKPKRSLKEMCAHSWNWQSKNPMGYRTNNRTEMKSKPVTQTNQQITIKGKSIQQQQQEVNNNDMDMVAYE
ncbi:hypothetical protein BLOT_000692 [Blomia tropicalis]|nr:hypothetical protein BLOT_000692 [Blomia tropicalis]